MEFFCCRPVNYDRRFTYRYSVLNDSFFSESYTEARERFLAAAAKLAAGIYSFPVVADSDDELFIDVAIVGDEQSPTVITSSAVHGVEGFFGSAVQLALLEQLQHRDCAVRHVLIHALNPFGFSALRRFNEDNVDLNRNFLIGKELYVGAPEGYAELSGLLNPTTPPSRFELYRLKALWNILRYGLPALKASIVSGQYEYPEGVFYGGSEPSQCADIVDENCVHWAGQSEDIVHIDFHTGLGPFSTYKLLLSETAGTEDRPEDYQWYCDTFGEDAVERFDGKSSTAYKVTGMFGAWMQHRFKSRRYRFVCAEFGTYGVIRVLGAIRAENRVYHHVEPEDPGFTTAKAELLECFCPSSVQWRHGVVESALEVIAQAESGVQRVI